MTTYHTTKSVNAFLQLNETLTIIVRKIDALKKIERMTHARLSEVLFNSMTENSFSRELLQSIQVTNYEKGRLQLLCDNAAISTRLRYLLPELINSLRTKSNLSDLVTIDLKVKQITTAAPASNEKKINLTSNSSKLLKGLLSTLKAI